MPLGVEDVSARELAEITGLSTSVDVGKVFFRGPLEAMYTVNYSARTINRLYLLLAREEFTSLSDIYRIAKSVDYTSVLAPDMSFAVRCERVGEHDFTSIDVARVVGQAVIDSYMESRGTRPRVNLDEPDVEISVFVRFSEVLIGVNTTGESLHRRRYRVYSHPAALKTTLAAAMLRLGEYRGEPLVDPLCGGATIPIEAAHMARRYPVVLFRRDYYFTKLPLHDPAVESAARERLLSSVNRDKYEITCIEISPKHVEGALANLKSARVEDTVRALNRDSTRSETYKDVNAKLVVTNPPYGMRSHSLKKIGLFYETLLRVLRDAYSGIRVVLITASTRQLEEAAAKTDVTILHSRRVMHGGLPAKIYVLRL
jgi:tRNA (guanine6-N2)-methyltransferase